ncbi:HlyD family type I secretion periplasmic adaptor subunit [Falsirhodobacter algicola]|uniref:Membrane fusion protein (MFP) family protein n=1 Tax=Falsirhodobacter algicola TaxID=2692330 RepID=A0A8J8MSL4_9RHOB|nr:HlyD family type I secretion periplasmic adaptor subunit [Falsirhodobacter algicola]QUS35956.1 HlyD family type I secretion periplasmic adaptor subunit [Falsirhodobacter algicola]
MILSARRFVMLGFVTLGLLLAVCAGWGALARIGGAVIAPGALRVQDDRQVVQHPDGGVVDLIAVRDGQAVAAGDLLLRLDGAELESELAIVEGQLFETMARRGRLTAERAAAPRIDFPDELVQVASGRADIAALLDGQSALFTARRDTLDRQVAQLGQRQDQIRSQIGGVDAQMAALVTQQTLIAQELEAQCKLLALGLTQLSRVLALEREEARLQGSTGELTAQRAEAEGRMTEYAMEALRLEASRREEAETALRDLGPQEMELAERRRALIQKLSRLDIRAPVAGVVLGLSVTTPRAVLQAAQPALYLIPQDRPLVVEARLPAINIDEVATGQPVRVLFTAFSGRATPELAGHLSLVSADALRDEATGASYYRVEVTLDDTAALGGRALVPGMPVEAFIATGDRSPLGYLTAPFTGYFRHAFRES